MNAAITHTENVDGPQVGLRDLLTGEAAVTANQLFDRKGTSRFAVVTVFAIFGCFAALTTWSYFLPLAEISVSSGEVIPTEQIQTVQHLEGGIVSEILVDEGERVAKGQALLRLGPEVAQSELDQFQTRLSGVLLRIDLLSRSLDDNAPVLDNVDPRYREIAEAEQRARVARKQSLDSQSQVLGQQVREREARLAALNAQKDSLSRQIVLAREQLQARQALVDEGLLSRGHILGTEREMAALVGQAETLELDGDGLREGIREARFRMVELQATFTAEITSEISQLTREAAELQLSIDRAQDRVERLTIRAPMDGRIKGLATRTVGGVVAPRAILMEIVPDVAPPLVEVRISTRDVGHIRVGQEAKIKVLTYDYTRYGSVPGRVARISPSTFVTEDGTPYYKAFIDLDTRFVGDDPGRPVTPGMTVIADIITGNRSLLDYLLAPIRRSVDAAMRER